eukprot:2862458-Prymnesium_polylepis.1
MQCVTPRECAPTVSHRLQRRCGLARGATVAAQRRVRNRAAVPERAHTARHTDTACSHRQRTHLVRQPARGEASQRAGHVW